MTVTALVLSSSTQAFVTNNYVQCIDFIQCCKNPVWVRSSCARRAKRLRATLRPDLSSGLAWLHKGECLLSRCVDRIPCSSRKNVLRHAARKQAALDGETKGEYKRETPKRRVRVFGVTARRSQTSSRSEIGLGWSGTFRDVYSAFSARLQTT